MPTTSATFTELYAPGLRKVIFENYTYLPTEYEKFLNIASSTRQYEEDYRMGGFGAVPLKPEGTNIIYDDPVPDTKVQYYWNPYGKGFRATHEAMADELYGPMQRMSQSLGKAFRNQTEIIGASILNNAFTDPAAGANNSGYEGLALCHTAHPLLRGGTYRNKPTTDVDISVTALQDATIDFERFVDESGVPIVLIPRKLIFAPEYIPIVKEILGSSQKPFTSDNETNILQGQFDPVVSHYMTDTNAWFLFADKGDTDVWLFWREKFTTDAADDFDSGDGKIKGYMRLNTGYGEPRGTWGSSGSS
jgi:hypothetical protein